MSAPTGLTVKTDLSTMNVGDCIPCRYTVSTSGTAGYFSELGTCTASEIPLTGTATPDGLFYFIKTDKGTFIADRVLQTNISWDVLNTATFIEGKSIDATEILPQAMTSNTTPTPLTITASNYYTGYYPWYAFDKTQIASNSSDAWFVYSTAPSTINKTGINKASHWIKIDFGSGNIKTINRVDLSACYIGGGNYGIKDFEIYTSTDDITYTLVYSGTHPNDYLWHSYNVTLSNARYVMFLVKSSYYDAGGGSVGIQKIRLYNNITPNTVKFRSLSGGIAYLDYTQKRICSTLLHFDGTNGSTTFIDSSPTPKTITAYGAAQIKTTVSKFGGSSVYLSSGNYLKISAHPDLNVGIGDYTIDFNIYLTTINSDNYFYDAFNSANKNAIEYYGGNLIYYAASSKILSLSCSIVANNWYHIEITRKSGTVYMFLNGVLLGSAVSSTDHSVNDDIVLGSYGGVKTLAPMTGYIDEFRIIKGNAENIASFIIPTQAYTESTNALIGSAISSLTNIGLGAFPPNNEWDKYIVNSTLNGKVIKNSDSIWNRSIYSWCKETSLAGTYYASNGSVGGTTNNTYRMSRGYTSANSVWSDNMIVVSSTNNTSYGFRPVLNYVESDIVGEVIY